MAKSWSLGIGNINLSAGEPGDLRVRPDTPFRILLVGDFRGRARTAQNQPLADRKPIVVDRDNFDALLAKFAPEVEVPLGPNQKTVRITFRELDDFEPDRLFQTLEVFDQLGSL